MGVREVTGDEVRVLSAADEVREEVSARSQSHFRQFILALGFILAPFCSCTA